jgi:hypothetical protein
VDNTEPLLSTPRAGHRMLARRTALSVSLVVLLLMAATLLLWQSSRARTRVPPGPVTLAGTRLTGSPFVGSKSCRECHPSEFAAHDASGHARTLRPANAPSVARLVAGLEVLDPAIPAVRWSLALEAGSLVARRTGDRVADRLVLDYAVGSGQHAVTFLSLTPKGSGNPEGLEHRISYFRHRDGLGLTPGHAPRATREGLTAIGSRLSPQLVRDCLGCHGTATVPSSRSGLTPESLIPHVSCERCHGPGRAHLEAAREPKADLVGLAMLFGPERWTAAQQLVLCGQCHRLPNMVPASTIVPTNQGLARFPSIGMSRSACYRRSNGNLSCTTCHDPHARVSTRSTDYETVCRSCHHSPGDPTVERPATLQVAPCPVKPESGCIACHMPRLEVGQGLSFTDHWLRRPDPPTSLERRTGPHGMAAHIDRGLLDPHRCQPPVSLARH